jgi:hypothetical protein
MSKKAKNDDDELKLEDCQNFEGVFEEDRQLKLPLPVTYIRHEEDNAIIYQRHEDGYVNATAMCKVTGKRWYDYSRLSVTKEFMSELSMSLKIPKTGNPATDIIVTKQGGDPVLQGTWIHPQLAVHLAIWLSPKFAVKVSKWVNDWITGKTHKPNLPYHLRRYYMNSESVHPDYFSILQEMTIDLLGKLELKGYILPSHLVPDISAGRMFSGWLKKQGVDTDKIPTYMHRYEDGRVFPAKMYPKEYLFAFKQHLNNVWLPKRSYKYFAERDKAALPYLNKLLDNYSKPVRLTQIEGESCK